MREIHLNTIKHFIQFYYIYNYCDFNHHSTGILIVLASLLLVLAVGIYIGTFCHRKRKFNIGKCYDKCMCSNRVTHFLKKKIDCKS